MQSFCATNTDYTVVQCPQFPCQKGDNSNIGRTGGGGGTQKEI